MNIRSYTCSIAWVTFLGLGAQPIRAESPATLSPARWHQVPHGFTATRLEVKRESVTASIKPQRGTSPDEFYELNEATGSSKYGTLERWIVDLVEHNPEIQAAQRGAEAARSRPSQVSSLPDPIIAVINRNVTRPIPFANLGDDPMSNGGVGITQAFPFPGKLRLRGKIAAKEADTALNAYRATVLRLTSELKQSYYRLHFLHQALAILKRQQEFLDQLARIAETRYSVGKGIQQDILRAQVEQSLLENRRILLEQEQRSLEARINSLLNRGPNRPLPKPEDYAKPVLAHTLAELFEMAPTRSPELLERRDRTDRSALVLRLARKDFRPDFSVSAAYIHRGPFSSLWETRFNVEVPLYFWRKQRYGIREAASRLAQSRHEYAAREQELLFRIKDEYLAAQASDRLISLYAKAIVPQASLALESSLASYEVGTIDFLTLMNNFVTILDYETHYWDQYARLAASLARLEALVATRLIP